MTEEKIMELAKKNGLNLLTKKHTTGEDEWTVFLQTRGGEPPEVHFTSTFLHVAAYVVGYSAGHLRGKTKVDSLKRRIIGAMEMEGL